MFATLHYKPGDGEMTCEELTDKPPSLNQPFSHSACFSCRDKKLKCTGEKSGCERCRKRDIVCEYAATAGTGDAGVGTRRSQRASSPRPSSPKRSSSKKDPPSKETSGIKVQRDELPEQSLHLPLGAATVQGDDTMMIPGFLADSVSSNSSHIGNPSSADFPFPQMPLPNFTTNAPYMDELLGTDFDMPIFDTNFNISDPKGDWQNSGVTTAGDNSIAPVLLSSEQPQPFLNKPQPQHLSSKFRMREDRRDTPQRSRSPKSETPPTPRTNSTAASSVGCSCRDIALKILEVLQPQRLRKPRQAVLQQLHFTKNIISQCQEIIECANCVKVSSLMVLVCVISENLVDVFEAVMLDWESKKSSSGQGSLHAKSVEAGLTSAADHNHAFGDYQVDTIEEWLSMTACLLLFQINRLDTILTTLQKNAVTSDWDSQLVMLQPIFQRLRSIKNKL